MNHVLDNPAWNALISGNKFLSNGNEQVKYFNEQVSPFVGLKNTSFDDFKVLYDLVPHETAIFISPAEIEIPGLWKILQCVPGLQMIYDNNGDAQDNTGPALINLTDEHIPQMLALTKLTNPGPFASRTIEFGHYTGIFEGGELVAMAGQRMHVFNYAEISAVCTHPACTGKGYAKRLLLHHINRIKAAGNIPFLHVRYDNERAIKLYEKLGFSVRTRILFYVMQKQK